MFRSNHPVAKKVLRPVAPSIVNQVSAFLAIVWRRRRLLVLPILLGLPLSLLAAYVAPRNYVARTMFLLQEGSNDLPLARELRATETSNEKVGGLRALLRSERVLGEAARELYGAEVDNDPKALAQKRKELDDRLSMWSEAPDFIELRLNGTEPVGLGRTLELIASKLMETVLTSGTGASLAPQLVTARLAKQIGAIQAKVDQLTAADAKAAAIERNSPAGRTLQDKLEDLQLSRDEFNVMLAGLGAPTSAFANSRLWLSDQVRQASQELAALQAAQIAGPARTSARARVLGLQQAATAQAFVVARKREVALGRPGNAAGQEAANRARARARLEADLASAKLAFEAVATRFQNQSGTSGPSFIRAPERIMVIDPPKDPDLPTRSRSLLVIVGMVCALLLGVGSVALAEFLDTRIRTAADLMAASGTEILGRLPPVSGAAGVASSKASS